MSRAAADRVTAVITDKTARKVVDSAAELADKSMALHQAILNWQKATGRQWEFVQKDKRDQVFPALRKAQGAARSAATATHLEALKLACQLGQVAR